MSKSNKDIVLEFNEEVLNKKQTDKFNDYISTDYVFHVSPYVGLGFNGGDDGEKKIKVTSIAKGGPADTKLQLGDEIIAASDETRKFETFEELDQSMALLGQGEKGKEVNLTVIRDGEKKELSLIRDKIDGFDVKWEDISKFWINNVNERADDRKSEIIHIMEDGDFVMTHDRNYGTVPDFNRYAVWDTSSVFKLKDGKIVEGWGVGPSLEYYNQLGFKVEPPGDEL